jgi:hypothetical protein
MKSKVLLQSIAKTVGAGRNKGDVSTSFRRPFKTRMRISAKTSYERYSKTKLPFLTWRMALL